MKTATIVIQNAPYISNNKAWHALRFAGVHWLKIWGCASSAALTVPMLAFANLRSTFKLSY